MASSSYIVYLYATPHRRHRRSRGVLDRPCSLLLRGTGRPERQANFAKPNATPS